ncbi:hypothetical protein MES4922_130155 [Mesorhizobium ventifaucium]|uniref:Uncharacterized protein n=1 Tax=Mesorhizobium ventifaucium TaxID=666020 RepID=A0ABN8JCG0_9HYPH|nr:hypothetical protein MES4922_130155 [Mesorhizobium ventifaucium]
MLQDDRMLDAALRQLSRFGYDLDRMEFVPTEDAELLGQVRQDYDRLTDEVTHVVDLVRAVHTDEARRRKWPRSSHWPTDLSVRSKRVFPDGGWRVCATGHRRKS